MPKKTVDESEDEADGQTTEKVRKYADGGTVGLDYGQGSSGDFFNLGSSGGSGGGSKSGGGSSFGSMQQKMPTGMNNFAHGGMVEDEEEEDGHIGEMHRRAKEHRMAHGGAIREAFAKALMRSRGIRR